MRTIKTSRGLLPTGRREPISPNWESLFLIRDQMQRNALKLHTSSCGAGLAGIALFSGVSAADSRVHRGVVAMTQKNNTAGFGP